MTMTSAAGAIEGRDDDRRYGQWIDGAAVPGARGTYAIVNPATEEVVGLAPEGSADDARAAAVAVAAAQPAWSQTTPERRAELLERAAALFESRYDLLVPLVQAETGATLMMTRTAQIAGTTARIRRYARGALEPFDKVFVPTPNYGGPAGPGSGLLNAMAVRQPVGVVAAITSYNVPLNNVMGKLAPGSPPATPWSSSRPRRIPWASSRW